VTDHRRAAQLMLLSAVAFSLMGVCVKMTPGVPVFEKVIFRNLITLLIALAVVLRNGRPLLGSRGNRRFLLLRAVLGVGGVACYFFAVDHLYLADAVMLNMLSPFVVSVVAALLLRERITPPLLVALCIAFVGGLLVIKPRFDLAVLPALAGLGSAAFAGTAYSVLRFLRDREPPETIVFVFSVVTVVGLAPVVVPTLETPTAAQLGWMLGIGMTAGAGQFALTLAYRHAPAGEVSLYGYSRIILSALLGYAVWLEIPDRWSLVGGALILVAAVVVFTARPSRTSPSRDRPPSP